MNKFIVTLFKTILFWLIFFAIHRFLFVVFNNNYIEDTPVSYLLASFGPGVRMDLSFIGYLVLLVVVLQLIALPIVRKFCFQCIYWQQYILIPVFSGLLLGDADLFRYWAGHLNSEAIGYLSTPDIIFKSIHWTEAFLFFLFVGLLTWLFVFLYNRFVVLKDVHSDRFPWKGVAINWGITLFVGGLMIIPIRGSFSVAPMNTGVAYFSNYLFANQAAINPLWNLGYSMKRNEMDYNNYRFIETQKGQDSFVDMMAESGEFPEVLKTDHPNVVVILLESFSGQIIKALGGEDVTPNLNKLIEKGMFFRHLHATSFRSDYGIAGVLAGYPGIPGYSVMQYPDKSRHLSFIPKALKTAGYKDFNFLYGGDMNFKNLRSFVTLAGFDDVVDIDDFPKKFQGKKWGVHDQYTFDRFLSMIENSKSPSFNFFFTLSSHEPYDVPVKRVYKDDYLNAIHYTDRCLGEFFKKVKEKGLWENTLFILVADHGVVGPQKASYVSKIRYQIPMVWTGGALAVSDTVITTYGSQIDIAATLLDQLNIKHDGFKFSKNILDKGLKGFSFMQYPNGFGYIDKNIFQMFDKRTSEPIVMEGAQSKTDSLKAKVFMQTITEDFNTRLVNGTN
jgi:phosphoglycerol transferase MdoB-like AlkP superfamily enzyme